MGNRGSSGNRVVVVCRWAEAASSLIGSLLLIVVAYIAVALVNILVSPKATGWEAAAVWCALSVVGIVLLLLAIHLFSTVCRWTRKTGLFFEADNISSLRSVSLLLFVLSLYTAAGCAGLTMFAGYSEEGMLRPLVVWIALSCLILASLHVRPQSALRCGAVGCLEESS